MLAYGSRYRAFLPFLPLILSNKGVYGILLYIA